MASYSIISYTATSVTLRATGLTAGNQIRFFIRLYANSADTSGDAIITAAASTVDHTFSGLKPGTSYTCNVAYPYTPGVNTWLGGQTVTTKSADARPYDWGWYSTIVSGGAIGLSALEWNNFCLRINEFRLYKDMSDYSFTAVSTGTVISASIVNEAWIAINEISGHGTMPNMAVSGGPLYASFFLGLTEALNAIE